MTYALQRAHEAQAERKRLGIKIKVKTPMEKHLENPMSLRFSINAMCFDCVGAGHDPDFRGTIRNCPCTDCPLFTVRPYQKACKEDEEE
jgi:hypothetical protein